MKPILFNTLMVKAIMEGRKTVTRRIIKNKYINADIEWFENKYGKRLVYMEHDTPPTINKEGSKIYKLRACEEIKKPYQIGDILYVRETWKNYKKRIGSGDNCRIVEFYGYKADEDSYHPSEYYEGNWKPSIHMPKEAARIFLRVTNIRAERLQDITTEGCFNEGITYDYNSEKNEFNCFQEIWDSTIKKEDKNLYSYKANPWVWVIEFEVVTKDFETGKYIKVFD